MENAIFVHVGQAGVQIGHSFWQRMRLEHQLDPTGKPLPDQPTQSNRQSIFSETQNGSFIPRAIFADSEPSVTDSLTSAHCGTLQLNTNRHLYKKSTIISGKDSCSTFARGSYTDGRIIADNVREAIRKESEMCDNLRTLIVSHSINGGTGSGVVENTIRHNSNQKVETITFSVFPSGSHSNLIVEPYNAILASHGLQEHASATIPFTNTQLYSFLQNNSNDHSAAIGLYEANQLISKVMSDFTAPLRFNRQQVAGNYRDLLTNCIPYRRMKLLSCSVGLLTPRQARSSHHYSWQQISEAVGSSFSDGSLLVKSSPQLSSKLMAAVLLHRGHQHEFGMTLRQLHEINNNARRRLRYCDWSPCGLKSIVSCSEPAPLSILEPFAARQELSLTNISNNTSVKGVLRPILKNFQQLYRTRAFFHHYCGEGMGGYEMNESMEEISIQMKDYEEAEMDTEPNDDEEEP